MSETRSSKFEEISRIIDRELEALPPSRRPKLRAMLHNRHLTRKFIREMETFGLPGLPRKTVGEIQKNLIAASRSPRRKPLIARTFRRWPTWPRIWSIGAFFLPKSVRREVYEPAIGDMLQQLQKRKLYRKKWARRLINLGFAFQTLLLTLDCFRAMGFDRAVSFARKIFGK